MVNKAIVKGVSFFEFHIAVVEQVQKDLRLSETQGFSAATRHIISEWYDIKKREAQRIASQGENES